MSYQKKTWVTKEIIKGVDLNHIEDGIADLSDQIGHGETDISKAYKTTDAVSSTIGDDDYIPIYTSSSSKRKTLFSTIKAAVLSMIPDWAKQPNKPTYTANEMNAVSTLPSQGLNNDQKTNARNNIGAGTSSFSGSYDDLTDLPIIGNGALTIKRNGTIIKAFGANQTTDAEANILVPTSTSELANDSGFITASSLPTVNDSTITIQKNGSNVDSFTVNQSSNKSINISLTKTDVGLANVGNYKAVSTEANQGLTSTEQSNARTNIGAGTSNFSGNYNDLTNKPTIPTIPGVVSTSANGLAPKITSTSGYLKGDGTWTTPPNTTYTFATGDSNGQIKVTPSDGTAQNVDVKGLGSAAYTNSSAYAAATHNQASNTINAMTGYAKASSAASITTSDTLNIAIGKLEKALDSKGGGTVTQVKVGDTPYDPSSGVISLPAYPTVNNATLTIQKNGTNVNTFTANASSNVTANITVPTKVSELTNDSGYITNAGVTGVKGNSESSYRTGQVNITASNIGLGNVGNFKAVSTVASQGLTDTEKSNARENIGAGTSSLTLGTSSTTAYRGDRGNSAYAHAVTNKGAAFASGLYKITTNAEGHVTAATAVAKADITALGIPSSDTNDKVKQSSSNTANWRKVLLGQQNDSTAGTAVTETTNQAYVTPSVEVQTSTGTLRATALEATTLNGVTIGDSPKFTDTNTKVTSVGNHYAPSADSSATLSADASSSTSATWGSTDLVTGVNLQRDAKGHVTGITVDSIQMPANPNTDTKYPDAVKNITRGSGDDILTYTCTQYDDSTFTFKTCTWAGYCYTAAGTAAKECVHTSYNLTSKTYTYITMANTNSAASALTLSINGKNPKPIYINGAASSETNHTLPKGTYLVYYNGTNYYFRTDGILTASITGKVNGHTVSANVPSNAVFTDTRDFKLGTTRAAATDNTLYFVYTT